MILTTSVCLLITQNNDEVINYLIAAECQQENPIYGKIKSQKQIKLLEKSNLLTSFPASDLSTKSCDPFYFQN